MSYSPSRARSPRPSPRMSRAKLGNNPANPAVPQMQNHEERLQVPNVPHPNLNRALGAQVLVEEVTTIMKENVKSLVEREGRLEDLANRAKNISESSKIFEKTTHKVQQTLWKQNRKLLIISIVISIIVVIMIAGILYLTLLR